MHGVTASLTELREMDAPEQLFEAVARATVERCGFDRVIVFTVFGDELVAQSVYFGDAEELAAETLRVGQTPDGRPHLADFIVETELVRRRSAAIVADAQNDPNTPRALVAVTRTRGYVAAPVLCERQVVGFIHADHYFHDVEVDEVDRDVLSAFVVGVGLILERQALRRHLQRQRAQLSTLAQELGAVADASALVDYGVAPGAPGEIDVSRPVDIFWDPTVREVLSAREREVIQLLVGGATNAAIARRLFISESTAKAHVHHILKKLGASNRAEAVAKFMRSSATP
jgi:DNA-binding CsgD family transcriptional regulator